MTRFLFRSWPMLAAFFTVVAAGHSAPSLKVAADFEGGSVKVLAIEDSTRTISFTPGGDAVQGWPCWWYFRIDGVEAGQVITLRLKPSDSVLTEPGAKPLAGSWAMPTQATWSSDSHTWRHTDPGTLEGDTMTYTLAAESTSLFVAWGPPSTPQLVAGWVREWNAQLPAAKAETLCQSREGRPVPMLHLMEGDLPAASRLGIWIQARQHAWETGGSWVARGLGDWLTGSSPQAVWLRQHAEIFLVPIMDVDHTATGQGGKDAIPHDHNRDWTELPHWNETTSAMAKVKALIGEKRMDLFLDLHNPAPRDPTFFFVLDDQYHPPGTLDSRNRFTELAFQRISAGEPKIPMSDKLRPTGPKYHPLWKQISANWVTMNGNPQTVAVCLETAWNTPNSTVEGYRAVGTNLGLAVEEFLRTRPTP